MSEIFTSLTSTAAVIPFDNIDTDQIIPARFLKTTSKRGLSQGLFAECRFNENGEPNATFVLNQPGFREAMILVVGANFGCGSSREHAAWALTASGFRVVIARSFGDIFRSNAEKNGLLTISLTEIKYQMILSMLREAPLEPITVNLVEQQIMLPDHTPISFAIDSFTKTIFVEGLDELGWLLTFLPAIETYEKNRSSNPFLR